MCTADGETLRRTLTTKGKARLTQVQQRTLARWAAAVYPTAEVLVRRGQWGCTQCPAGCGAEDSLEHRLWHCPIGRQAREQLLADGTVEAAYAQLPEITRRCGLVHADNQLRPDHWADEDVCCTLNGEPVESVMFDASAPIYGDGSCAEPSCQILACAAWALWQRTRAGDC